MTVKLDEYRGYLEYMHPHLHDTLEASFVEAAHVMSPAGLHDYLDGAKALSGLGRGTDLVESYLQALPVVAKEVGEDVTKDCSSAAMKLASMVSGEVISLLFASLPTAARRLGDAALLRNYLNLIHQLSAKAPRGLRPMLTHLDQLFSKLTLGGLRRWAMWGAQNHGRDFRVLYDYFDLATADSLAVLQRERRGTLFVDCQRRLNFYLRALWGRDFFMRPTSGDYETREGYQPYIEKQVIHLPDAFDDYAGVSGGELYRAAAAHAAAHLMYRNRPLSAEALNPVPMFLIGLLEDARIEFAAIRTFPGLQHLWRQFHHVDGEHSTPAQEDAGDAAADPWVDRLERLALALLDVAYRDKDEWVNDVTASFRSTIEERWQDPGLSWDLGIDLYNRVGARSPSLPSLRVLQGLRIPYRDDNRYIWAFDEADWTSDTDLLGADRQVRKTVNVMEMANEVDCELAGDDAQEVWTLESEFFRDGDPVGVSINELEGKERVSEPFHYPEWDYQVQLHRPDWVTVLEKRQPQGDAKAIENILLEYRPLASRIRHIIDALQPEGIIRQRHQEDGDEIDINAAIRAMVDLRLGLVPDPRINIRSQRKTRDLAILVLLDLSESTNEVLAGSDRPVLQLTREAAALLAWSIDAIGDPFALHGFASDGRHDVHYYRYKDFGQPYDDTVRARLAGMRGGLSTRMGAALRHAGSFLDRQPQGKKLILLVSDGEPSDIDVRDPQYLRKDTKRAVEELATHGINTYCLTLDTQADEYVSRIFGINGYTIVDHVQRLPEKLPTLFAALTAA
jgi:nitric oxide reductase NorD protein